MIPKTPSEQELNRIAASIRLTGELLEANGSRAVHATASWSSGPRSANLDPDAGGWQYDEAGEPIPNDTTGEQALRGDPYTNGSERLISYVVLADQINGELRRMLYAACPQNTMPESFDPDTPAQVSAAGWCVSCHRDSGYCEPVSMRPDGTRRYRDFCTWCGEFVAQQERLRKATQTGKRKKKKDGTVPLPPIELVQARHRGDRITQQMVDRALGRHAKAS